MSIAQEFINPVTYYLFSGQVVQQVRAENTPLQQIYKQITYSANGLALTKRDARDNLATQYPGTCHELAGGVEAARAGEDARGPRKSAASHSGVFKAKGAL
jgi:hypothetical protein